MKPILSRANTTALWLPSDTKENYVPILRTGRPNKYKDTDITYQFNEFGFRCDSFNLSSELPIVFLGCSYTEGIGLPINKVWSNIFLKKICETTGKNIPYWNLALGGKGIDNQIGLLHDFITLHSPQYIFCLFPPPGRREYWFNSICQTWIPNPVRHKNQPFVNELFSDPDYIKHADYQSVRMLSLIQQTIPESKIIATCWDDSHSKDTSTFYESLASFSNINYFKFPKLRYLDLARDNQHPGEDYHKLVAEIFWEQSNTFLIW